MSYKQYENITIAISKW